MDNDFMRVDIRLPGMTRALYIAYFGLIGAIALLVGGLGAMDGSAVAPLVAAPIAGLGTLAATRFSMLAVTVEGETLDRSTSRTPLGLRFPEHRVVVDGTPPRSATRIGR
jgi:hypothetical protein